MNFVSDPSNSATTPLHKMLVLDRKIKVRVWHHLSSQVLRQARHMFGLREQYTNSTSSVDYGARSGSQDWEAASADVPIPSQGFHLSSAVTRKP